MRSPALAWQHHRNVSAYEAFYVAAARARGLPLRTARSRTSGEYLCRFAIIPILSRNGASGKFGAIHRPFLS